MSPVTRSALFGLAVLQTVQDALEDPVYGLLQRARELARYEGREADLRAEVEWHKWRLSGELKKATTVNVSVGIANDRAGINTGTDQERLSEHSIEIGLEMVGADTELLTFNVSCYATALLQVVDYLVEFSDNTGGTIQQVREPVAFSWGDFGPGRQGALPITTSGFTATFTVQERSPL